MDDFNRLTIKTFRGGISADEDKGPVGAFRYGQGLNIHDGQDSLKCNQKLKEDTLEEGELFSDLPLTIVPASDGNKFAFGDTGKIYRKKAGEWVEMYDMNSKISGATEYESITGTWILFATVTKLYKILLRHASNLDDWTDRIVEVGSFKGAAEGTPTFKTSYAASKYGYIMKGIVQPSGSVPPEVLVSAKNNASGSSTTISVNITVPDKPNLQMIIFVGTYNATGLSGVTVSGDAATNITGGTGNSGSFNIGFGMYRFIPTAGSKTVTATFSAGATNRFIYVVVVEGAHQVSPVTGFTSEFPVTIPATSIETTLAETASNQLRLCLFAAEQTTFTTVADKQILLQSANTGSVGTEALYYKMPFVAEDNIHTGRKALGDAIFCDGQRLTLYDYQDSFNNEALTLPDGTSGKVLLDYSDEGVARIAVVAESSSGCLMITWDGLADSWLTKKTLKSNSIYNMGFLEGGIIALSENGNLKYWNFSDSYPYKDVPGVESGLPGAVAEFKGKSHFGWSGSKGGVYSIGRNERSRPIAINLEYLPSPVIAGDTTADEITYGAIASDGDELYVAWKYNDGEEDVFGMDIIDENNKAPAIYESLKMDGGRPESEKGYKQIKVVAETIPEGCSVVVQYRSTRLSGSEEEGWNDAEQSDGGTGLVAGDIKGIFDIEAYGEEYEVRVTLNPSGNSTPEVKSITTFFEFDNDL